jgi:hypothetical protein
MRAIWIGLALGLTGCGGQAYDWHTMDGGGAGLPVAAMRASSEVVVPPTRGPLKTLAVRTFVPGNGPEGWNEVEGVTCRVEGAPYFSATVVTPVRLALPDLGPDAPALQASCEQGALRGQAAVAPAFSWPEEGRPSAPTRIWWGGGWWWGFQKTGPLRYPDLAVALR